MKTLLPTSQYGEAESVQEQLFERMQIFQDLLERSRLLESDDYCRSLCGRIEAEIIFLREFTVRGASTSTDSNTPQSEDSFCFIPGYN